MDLPMGHPSMRVKVARVLPARGFPPRLSLARAFKRARSAGRCVRKKERGKKRGKEIKTARCSRVKRAAIVTQSNAELNESYTREELDERKSEKRTNTHVTRVCACAYALVRALVARSTCLSTRTEIYLAG